MTQSFLNFTIRALVFVVTVPIVNWTFYFSFRIHLKCTYSDINMEKKAKNFVYMLFFSVDHVFLTVR